MDLDTADAEDFDQAVAAVAQALKDLGDTDDLDIRRARAVGILADPQAALDLLHRAQAPGRKPGGGSATLHLHLDLATLADLAVHGITGPVYDERWGTATTDLIKQWLTDWLGDQAQLKVQPYLDLNHPETITPVDGHDPTPAMVMFCRLRDPYCVFPGCKNLPASATSTTSWPTSHPTTADHPARPIPTTSPHSAADTTVPRPTADGTTVACPTAATGGPPPPAAPSTSHRHARGRECGAAGAARSCR